jgi:L-ascorbate metabolism protein UlaG (beta-lactamase superfamily)
VGALYDLAFPRQRLGQVKRAASNAPGVRISWLGTAAYIVSTERTTVLIDPYVSRHGLRHVALRKLEPDDDAIARWVPKRVDAVLCGHSHYDHLLDAPRIARNTAAKLVGSRTTCAFARAEGVPETQLVLVEAHGADVTIGDMTVRFVPSLHGRIALGRVPFPGEVHSPPRLPARVWEYKMGGAFGILIDAAGVRVYHNGSADLVDAELEHERADVLLVGLAGRFATRDYLKRLVTNLSPRVVVPTHHDAFFAPLEAGVHLLPGIDLDGFRSEVRMLAPHARVHMPDYGEALDVVRGEAHTAASMS